ncbi:hypothetical protein ACOMHN_022861 [Nucella lapillus]
MMNLAQRITEKFEDRRIRLNVGGVVFETLRSTLRRKPSTRLAQLADRLESDDTWDLERQEYFFDRHPGVFASILHSYRTEELHTEHNLCGNIIKTKAIWAHCSAGITGHSEGSLAPMFSGHHGAFRRLSDPSVQWASRGIQKALGPSVQRASQGIQKAIWAIVQCSAGITGQSEGYLGPLCSV